MNSYLDWDSKFEDGDVKYYDSAFNKYVCKNGFYSFINKYDDITFDNKVTKTMLLRDYGDNKYEGELIIYKSTKPDTLYIDECCVDEIGRFNLFIDDGNE